MTRQADPALRADLLERIVEYVLDHGVASLSLRPLAVELGVTPGLLLYHFGSKERLVVDVLADAGRRQRALFRGLLERSFESPAELCHAMWRVVSAPGERRAFALFFEVYGLALADPERFPGFLPAAVDSWLDVLAPMYAKRGLRPRDARAEATVDLAAFRGFLLDLVGTGDRARVDRAFARWSEAR